MNQSNYTESDPPTLITKDVLRKTQSKHASWRACCWALGDIIKVAL